MQPRQQLQTEPVSRVEMPGPGEGSPTDERACVVTALRLGWWMADAYHHARTVELGEDTAARPVAPRSKLSNLTEMSGRQRMRMYLDGVEVALDRIAALTGQDGTGALSRQDGAGRLTSQDGSRQDGAGQDETGPLARRDGAGPCTAAVRARIREVAPGRPADVDALLVALDELNVDVLRWAMARDHRIGLAYRLGRSLADTVRRCDAEQLAYRFGGRQHELRRWLDELAGVLPPYSAPVVRHSLARWTTAVRAATAGDPAEAELGDLAEELRDQGDVWRSVLTGGLHPRDLLDEGHYAVVARNLIIRDRRLVVQAARGICGPVLVPLLVILLAVVGVSVAAAAGSPAARVGVALLGLGAGLAAGWRAISGPALQVAGEVNRPLLHSELVVQMADCVSRPLDAARTASHTRRTGATLR
ncbi:hypothetical protein GA0074692_5672 [Micromonospora pallida]|uniref:Uncharacterized protein n=1 Tax=Micromonospora pallida TaxID=145854 RepID=A0A1C6TEH6_9ACTN|nr:hypothetical protein [Micromonospora pallida]SCL40198.1 hypothetical protein GA0074692_5672 [Micromonospora pallida]